jgi:ABC-2 type transport system ATP-binding protein
VAREPPLFDPGPEWGASDGAGMIEVSGLTRYYGEFAALRNVSFTVREGEIIGLLGLNGAGKSTTLKVLAGLLPPSSGRVLIDGIDVGQAPEQLKARIGYLPEDPPLYRDMTVSGFLRHIGRLKGLSSAQVERRIPEVIALTDLTGREHQVIQTLSHGYKKRVGIAQAVIHDPRLVILDEPISGLDPKQIIEMRKVIRNLGQGRAVLISSHILSEISQTCDRIFILDNGQLKMVGTEEELTKSIGDARIVVTVRGDQAAFEAWLRAHPLVETFHGRAVPPPYASAVIDLKGDTREQFIPAVAAAGYGIRLVEVPDNELEEIFLGLTRSEAPGLTA